MKKYLKIFNLVLLLFLNSLYVHANEIDSEKFYPDFEVVQNGECLRLVFIKINGSSSFKEVELYSIDKNNEKKYIRKMFAQEIVAVFQADGIADGKSVYIMTRSKRQDAAMNGYYFNTTELAIIEDEMGISVEFFPGDPPEPALTNCFDGIVHGKQVSCKYKTSPSIKEYIANLYSTRKQ